ncbi:aromatic amino acid lyase [Actinoplanes sp. NPDC051494]|uniref:aromatic amino acid lyase n=1 Tax=Actinoplanes sp. NPDC051494 TaxID=3363907 RepID=UPI00378DCB73
MSDPAARNGGPVVIGRAGQLDRAVILRLARGDIRVTLDPELVAELAANRQAVLAALDGDQPVYGVNTGMGALAGVRLDAAARARHQDTLMTGRAVGSAPWLRRDEARALLAVRLRTLLDPAAGVSPGLCQRLIDLLDADVVPAVPARGGGAAGEIIPLAHTGAVLLGTGQVLGPASDARPTGNALDAGPTGEAHDGKPAGGVLDARQAGGVLDARQAGGVLGAGTAGGVLDAGVVLAAAGIGPRTFGAKEGVAFLEGVPGLTGLAILAGADARVLVEQVLLTSAVAHAVVRASRDPLHPDLADSDELRSVLATTHELIGDDTTHALQAPVSFRVTAPALAVVLRAAGALDDAVDRALGAVTDSPAYLGGRFVGTSGFAGTDLTAALGALTTALIHLAEVGTARLHRLLDPAVTGLTRQLSDSPGVHAGMVAVHKRAVGVTHRLRRFALPALVGAMETSLGQEDVQSFGFEAAECAGEAVAGLRDVLACELLALHQALRLGGTPGSLATDALDAVAEVAAVLPAGTGDRPFGRDLDRIIELLSGGWPRSSTRG